MNDKDLNQEDQHGDADEQSSANSDAAHDPLDYSRYGKTMESPRHYQHANKTSFRFSPPEVKALVLDTNAEGFWDQLGITREEYNELVEFRANHEIRNRYKLFLSGVLFMPVTLLGAIVGYIRSYNRFYRHKDLPPNLFPLSNISRFAIAGGIGMAWLAAIAVFLLIGLLFFITRDHPEAITILTSFYGFNLVISTLIFSVFIVWRIGIKNTLLESNKFGSARFARQDELYTLKNTEGYYIGQGHLFNDRGHILTVAGTRGGKGTNLIIPNLLDAGNMETSWVVIDPKGENGAVSSDYQRQKGQYVVILNPWGLLSEHIVEAQRFNPLDILGDISDPNLVDDVQMMAEMIVPIKQGDHNSFFTDSARIIISGLLLHLVTTETGEKRTLKTLWEWVRLESSPEAEEDPWNDLLAEMGLNETPVNGEIVQSARREIMRMSEAGGETFGSIMSDVLLNTDFIKSPPLQESLKSGFDPKILADGKTTVYIVIPADKLKSHARWLRLVTTSLMRAVIRKPNKRVTFILDEFAALGYLPEIETALSTYAGYNVTVWPILQTLGQLAHLYGNNWQTFIGNCTVRQYFSVNDNETADYVAAAIGMTSNVTVTKSWFGVKDAKANDRFLITPDELRRASGKKIFMFIGDLPPTYVEKVPYYLVENLRNKAERNPYFN